MRTLNLALIGFGAVGQGFVELLHEQAESLAARYGLRANIVGVATQTRGALFRLDGLNIPRLLEAVRGGDLRHYADEPRLIRGLSAMAILSRPGVDVVIELSHTNLQTGEPAIGHLRAALAAGKHVITANKGPIALAWPELSSQAEHRDLFIGYEGTVLGGTPALRFARTSMPGTRILGARGILNSTTNFILTAMESGGTYADALAEAQRLGYAEADPSGDVEGFDAAGKVLIVANVIMGAALKMSDVARQGITGLTPADIESARAANERWRLIASVTRDQDGRITASVRPERLPLSDPLASVSGVTNAITYQTDILGPQTLVGAGAGGRATGFAVLTDLIELAARD